MNEVWRKAATELSLCGLRVFVFLLVHRKEKRDWTPEAFVRWTGMIPNTGRKNWRDGIANLVEKGFIEFVDERIEMKIVRIEK